MRKQIQEKKLSALVQLQLIYLWFCRSAASKTLLILTSYDYHCPLVYGQSASSRCQKASPDMTTECVNTNQLQWHYPRWVPASSNKQITMFILYIFLSNLKNDMFVTLFVLYAHGFFVTIPDEQHVLRRDF